MKFAIIEPRSLIVAFIIPRRYHPVKSDRLLGSSLYSAQLAGMLGLPYAFAGHFAPRLYREAIQVYRAHFQPSQQLDTAYAMLAVPAIAADTDAEAQWLATTSQQRILALMRGRPLFMEPPIASMEGLWSPQEEAAVREFLGLQLCGGPATLGRQLQELLATVEVDELMFTVDIHDPALRRHALGVLAGLRCAPAASMGKEM